MAAATAATALLEAVRTELRREGVRLWLPPYTAASANESAAGEAVAALEALAGGYAQRLGSEAPKVLNVLQELRSHAVEKLRARSRVTLLVRVLGSSASSGNAPLRLEFDSATAGSEVRAQLCSLLQLTQLKAVAGGRTLQDAPALGEQGWVCDQERHGQPLKVLLFPGEPAREPTAAAEEPKAAVAAAAAQPAPAAPRCSVAQIREAAEQLTAEGFGDFELSDAATGRLVPVPAAARQALIAAIALHALGREQLSEREGEASSAPAAVAEALEFLAEADRCFERCREAGAGQLLDQIDNFGQLQLDMCWAYALLGDADHLPDAERRLEAADRMFRRRVDRNFLTLAEVKAEQGHTLPPEVLPSVRIWLLRGIVRRCRGDVIGARDDLQRAAIFMRALQVDSSAVDALLTMGATRAQAVAELRRSGGSADRAAEAFVAAEAQRRAARRERRQQKELGTANNGSFVDPAGVSQLEAMGIEREAAVKALKDANNDVAAAAEAALTRAGEAQSKEEEVDELALASLLSMGFEQKQAEAALRVSGGNVEEAMLALTAAPLAEPSAPSAEESAPAKEAAAAKESAKEEAERAAKRARKEALDAAREIVERELGNCLRRSGLEDDLAGTALVDEEVLLQQHLSCLDG